MSDDRFELVFSGQLITGMSALQARQSLQARFKLSDDQIEQLFAGAAVTVKRNLDQAAAERYRQAFLEAGAVVAIQPYSAPTASRVQPETARTALQTPLQPNDSRVPSEHADSSGEGSSGPNSRLHLLPPGTPVGEAADTAGQAPPDTSRLSLAPSEDMTLADCAPPAPEPPALDLDRYALAPLETDAEDDPGPDPTDPGSRGA